jgi:hypothetical protein
MLVHPCRVLALLMGVFVGAVFFQVSFNVSGAQNRVGERRGCRESPPDTSARPLVLSKLLPLHPGSTVDLQPALSSIRSYLIR